MKRIGVSQKTAIGVAVISSIALVAFGFFDYYGQASRSVTELREKLELTTNRIVTISSSALWNFETAQIEATLGAEGNDRDVDSIIVKGGESVDTFKVVKSAKPSEKGVVVGTEDLPPSEYSLSREVRYGEKTIGLVTVNFNGRALQAKLRSTALQKVVETIVLNLCIIVTLFLALRTLLVRPLSSVITGLGDESKKLAEEAVILNQDSSGLATGATQQATAIQSTAQSLEELSATTAETVATIETARSISEQAKASADGSRHSVEELSRAMRAIADASDRTTEIIKTIETIAFQTNLLALNASVEAARAGDAGRGFAVVAEEVRNLAQRSTEAARKTTATIQEALQATKGGAAITDKVGLELTEIAERVLKIDSLMVSIDQSSKEQRTGISLIKDNADRINGLIQQTADAAHRSNDTACSVEEQANILQDQVKSLRSLL